MSKIGIWVSVSLLLVYFMFNSGFVYEALKYETASKIDIPYSYALSADRVGMVGIFNEDDLKCAEWYIEHMDSMPIVADCHSYRIFAKFGMRPIAWFWDMPEEGYVFLSTWNVEHGEYVDAIGVGQRERKALPEFKGQLVYQSGIAKIYKLIPPPPLPQKR